MKPQSAIRGSIDEPTDINKLSDEAYLVARARKERKTNPWGAKAWMITAKLMFPKNFSIQYEAYCLEKDERKASEAARYLKSLFEGFGKEAKEEKLNEELASMVNALQGEKGQGGEEEAFLVSVYENLPEETRQKILTESAQKSLKKGDLAMYAKQVLVACKSFEELVPTQGKDLLIDLLGARKAKEKTPAQTDQLLEILVLQICPQLLPMASLELDRHVLLDLMFLAVEYSFMFVSRLAKDIPAHIEVSPPWKTILPFVEVIGRRLGWTLTEDMSEMLPDVLWQRVQNAAMRRRGPSEVDELMNVASLAYAMSLYDYIRETSLPGEECVFVQAFVAHLDEAAAAVGHGKEHKRRRTTTDDDRKFPLVTHGQSHKSKVVVAFNNAYRYHDLIKSDDDLAIRIQALDGYTRHFGSFKSDVYLFLGQFREAMSALNGQQIATKDDEACRKHVKASSLLFWNGDTFEATDNIVKAVLSSSAAPSSDALAASKCVAALKQATTIKHRHVHFLPFTRQNVIAYSVRLLVSMLKEKILQRALNKTEESAIGCTIVLLQYIYPEEVDLFHLLLKRIASRDSFKCPFLLSFLLHIEFLEEISCLYEDPKRTVALDICTTGPAVPAGTRKMGTRGANREEKEEIRSAISLQARKNVTNLDAVIVRFLEQHKRTIEDCLL